MIITIHPHLVIIWIEEDPHWRSGAFNSCSQGKDNWNESGDSRLRDQLREHRKECQSFSQVLSSPTIQLSTILVSQVTFEGRTESVVRRGQMIRPELIRYFFEIPLRTQLSQTSWEDLLCSMGFLPQIWKSLSVGILSYREDEIDFGPAIDWFKAHLTSCSIKAKGRNVTPW